MKKHPRLTNHRAAKYSPNNEWSPRWERSTASDCAALGLCARRLLYQLTRCQTPNIDPSQMANSACLMAVETTINHIPASRCSRETAICQAESTDGPRVSVNETDQPVAMTTTRRRPITFQEFQQNRRQSRYRRSYVGRYGFLLQ